MSRRGRRGGRADPTRRGGRVGRAAEVITEIPGPDRADGSPTAAGSRPGSSGWTRPARWRAGSRRVAGRLDPPGRVSRDRHRGGRGGQVAPGQVVPGGAAAGRTCTSSGHVGGDRCRRRTGSPRRDLAAAQKELEQPTEAAKTQFVEKAPARSVEDPVGRAAALAETDRINGRLAALPYERRRRERRPAYPTRERGPSERGGARRRGSDPGPEDALVSHGWTRSAAPTPGRGAEDSSVAARRVPAVEAALDRRWRKRSWSPRSNASQDAVELLGDPHRGYRSCTSPDQRKTSAAA